MSTLSGITTHSSLHDLVDKPFLFISIVPERPKCHGVQIRRLSVDNINIDTSSDGEINELAQLILHNNELKCWETLPQNNNRRLEWLFGRIAAKDALRYWSWQTLDIICTPFDVEIAQDNKGKPYIKCKKLEDFDPLPDISISHYRDCAVAALSLNGSKIGIDFEDINKRKIGDWMSRAFTTQELELVEDHHDGQLLLSLWTAKEAASKALGIGLQGRWREWRITQIACDNSVATVTYKDTNYTVRLYQNDGEMMGVCQI